MQRQVTTDHIFLDDVSLDTWIHKFVLNVLVLGIVANCIRFVFSLHSYPGEIFPYAGTPVSIVFLTCVTLVLWRRPQFLRPIVLIVFIVMTGRIAFQFVYILLAGKVGFDFQLLWISGLMSINYFTPFIIFRSRTASTMALITLAIWMTLSGIYVVTHWEMQSAREMFSIFSQMYATQSILIVFMVWFVRLRELYQGSQKSVFRFQKLAHTDFLLGTANRRSIEAQLKKRIEHLENAPLSVLLIDVDHFKKINDHHGHGIGDEVLIEIVGLISRHSRFVNDFGRWGGEEFLMILPHCDATDACKVAERIRNGISSYSFRVGQVTASFGVTEFRSGDNVDSLLSRADDALYVAKKSGRNRVELANQKA